MKFKIRKKYFLITHIYNESYGGNIKWLKHGLDRLEIIFFESKNVILTDLPPWHSL